MILTKYAAPIAKAEQNQPCAVCGRSVLGLPIYWHGYGFNKAFGGTNHSGLVTHSGCYWDDTQLGPAPYLLWKQITTFVDALRGADVPRDLEEANRFLDALNLALRERESALRQGPNDVGMRLGPGLVAGYEIVVRRLDTLQKFLALKDASGGSDWVDMRGTVPTTPWTPKPAQPAKSTDAYDKAARQRELDRIRENIRRGRTTMGVPMVKQGSAFPGRDKP